MAQFLISSTIGIGLIIAGMLIAAVIGVKTHKISEDYIKCKTIAETLNALDFVHDNELEKMLAFKVNSTLLRSSKYQIIYVPSIESFQVIKHNNLKDK